MEKGTILENRQKCEVVDDVMKILWPLWEIWPCRTDDSSASLILVHAPSEEAALQVVHDKFGADICIDEIAPVNPAAYPKDMWPWIEYGGKL